MKRPPEPLDASSYTIVPHVAIVDEFVMTNADGSFKAEINESWLQACAKHMTERERATGDLCPYVIGHTPDEPFNEADPTKSPPVIGYLRNWHVDDLFETGRKATFADVWIMKGEEERAKRFPRRSAEIYVDRYEIDPCSALGPTTPARDLGLLKLARDSVGSLKLTRDCPDQRCEMPEPKKDEKVADPKETSQAKTEDGKLDQVLAMLGQLLEKLSGGAANPAAAPDAAPAGDASANPGDELSDDELLKMLEGMPGDEGAASGAAAAGATPPEATDAKKNEKKEKESREAQLEAELAETKTKLARTTVESTLRKLHDEGYIAADPNDANLVNDLIAMPAEMQGRMIEKLKMSRSGAAKAAGGGPAGWLEVAMPNATGGQKFITTQEDHSSVLKLARDKKCTYGQAARELGFTTAE